MHRHHGGRRSVRSVARSVDRVDRFGRFGNFADFHIFCHVGELEICPVSKFQVCTTLGGRKNAEKPKREFSEFFGSVGSVFRSVRSILRPRDVVDRPANVTAFTLYLLITIRLRRSPGNFSKVPASSDDPFVATCTPKFFVDANFFSTARKFSKN